MLLKVSPTEQDVVMLVQASCYVSSSKMSCDDFAPTINRLGLTFPHGVLNVATFLDLSSTRR